MSLVAGSDVVVRAISVPKDQLVFVRHVLEASEGLGIVVTERGGQTWLVGPKCQERTLDRLIRDLSEEVGLKTLDPTFVRGECDA